MEQNNQKQKPCGCGRSPTGHCNGWHMLTNEQYEQKKSDQQKLNESKLLQE